MRLLLLLLLLPIVSQADDFLQLRHVVGSDGVGYTILRADPADLIAGPILSSLTATANAPGYSCLVMRDSQFTALASTWTGIQAAMAANHFTLTQEQQSYCTDTVIPPYVPPQPAPPPAPTLVTKNAKAVFLRADGVPAQGIGAVPDGTPCGAIMVPADTPVPAKLTWYWKAGLPWYAVTFTDAKGVVRSDGVTQGCVSP